MCSEAPRILCIDDQLAHVEVRAVLLRLFGCFVAIESDPADGLRRLESEEFDLVLLDYHLANGVMGDGVACQIREKWPNIRILMLTGDAKIGDSARNCADAVLIKGASDPGELWEMIHKLVPHKPLKPRRGPVRFIPPKAS